MIKRKLAEFSTRKVQDNAAPRLESRLWRALLSNENASHILTCHRMGGASGALVEPVIEK